MKNFFELTDNVNNYSHNTLDHICQKLSLRAKYLYDLLLQRTGLSIHNGKKWYTPGLGVFVIFSREEAAAKLKCSIPTIISTFRQLATAGLIFEERLGQGKANRIYVCKPDLPEQEPAPAKPSKTKRRQKPKSEIKAAPQEIPTTKSVEHKRRQKPNAKCKTAVQEIKQETPEAPVLPLKPAPSKVDNQPSKKGKTPHRLTQRPYQSRRPQAPAFFVPEEVTSEVKEKIEYSYFVQNKKALGITKRLLDMIVRCLSELLAAPTTKVSGILYTGDECEQMLETVNADTILAFLQRLKEISFNRVHNVKAYTKSTLFNFVQEMAVREDGWEEEVQLGMAML